MREMQGKRVWVIGGGSGIGASVARLAADAVGQVEGRMAPSPRSISSPPNGWPGLWWRWTADF